MKVPVTVFTAILLCAAGCSKPAYYWYSPDKTLEQARADYRECRRYARQEAAEAVADEHFDLARLPSRPPRSYGTAHDIGPSEGPLDAWTTWGEMYQQNVFDGCMGQRGYARIKAHRLPSDLRTKSFSLGAIAGR